MDSSDAWTLLDSLAGPVNRLVVAAGKIMCDRDAGHENWILPVMRAQADANDRLAIASSDWPSKANG
jgi:hypothetical protein